MGNGQGYPALAKAAKATVQRILDAQTLQSHKVKYYMERRFKPANVLSEGLAVVSAKQYSFFVRN